MMLPVLDGDSPLDPVVQHPLHQASASPAEA